MQQQVGASGSPAGPAASEAGGSLPAVCPEDVPAEVNGDAGDTGSGGSELLL